jgi:hypothetical protein
MVDLEEDIGVLRVSRHVEPQAESRAQRPVQRRLDAAGMGELMLAHEGLVTFDDILWQHDADIERMVLERRVYAIDERGIHAHAIAYLALALLVVDDAQSFGTERTEARCIFHGFDAVVPF